MESDTKEQFWILRPPLFSDRKEAEWDYKKNDSVWMKHLCALNPSHLGTTRKVGLKVLLRGGQQDDFVWTCYRDCLVQKNVAEFLKKGNYTGFSLLEAQARFKSGKSVPPSLWEVKVNGYAGMLLSDALRLREHCDVCGTEQYDGDGVGVAVNPATWDGSDFSMAWPLPRYIFISDRLAKDLLRAGFSGYSLECPENLDTNGGYGPGSLAYWISPDKLREFAGRPPHPGSQYAPEGPSF